MTSPLLRTLVVPAASGTPTASVIFAHGLGDSGLGWLDVAKMLSRRPSLRHVRFILPNAPSQPVTLNMGMSMPSWFDITTLEDMADGEDEKGMLKSAGEIKRLIQAEVDGSAEGLAGRGIEPGRVVVGGFSQVSGRRAFSTSVPRSIRWASKRLGADGNAPASASSSSRLPSTASISSKWTHAAKDVADGFSVGGREANEVNRILGIGVDVMHRPRLASLLRRQTHRQSHRSGSSQGDPPLDASRAAIHRFARRVLCQAELEELSSLAGTAAVPPGQLEQWLAVRWTAKEATYKALYPSLIAHWSDLRVSKGQGDGDRKPQIQLSAECARELRSAVASGMRLHLSVSHDGDYVVSFVVAEIGDREGAAISYLVGLSHPTPLAGIIALSGWLPLRSKIPSLLSPHAKETPIFHGHGSSDQIVQFDFGKRSVEFLKDEKAGGLGMGDFRQEGGKAQGVRFEVYRGMAHSACPEEIEHVGQFLESIVPKL